jgi:hypothetical protein
MSVFCDQGTQSAYIEYAQDLLSPNGRFYLVAIHQNHPLKVIEHAKTLGLTGEVSSLVYYLSLHRS